MSRRHTIIEILKLMNWRRGINGGKMKRPLCNHYLFPLEYYNIVRKIHTVLELDSARIHKQIDPFDISQLNSSDYLNGLKSVKISRLSRYYVTNRAYSACERYNGRIQFGRRKEELKEKIKFGW
ncbi:hypothetical protein R5R35_004513 [Gryllus longicercus]|uniref:Uncharacterized protein n=1 Tax=Gryllus longicercus TaxID=2509291 RepID=A0AAN9V9C1_9ORTH